MLFNFFFKISKRLEIVKIKVGYSILRVSVSNDIEMIIWDFVGYVVGLVKIKNVWVFV